MKANPVIVPPPVPSWQSVAMHLVFFPLTACVLVCLAVVLDTLTCNYRSRSENAIAKAKTLSHLI